MDIQKILIERSDEKCELCGATEELQVYEVNPSDGSAEHVITSYSIHYTKLYESPVQQAQMTTWSH